MLKRIVRRGVNSARAWLREPSPEPATHRRDFSQDRFAYGRLNAIVEEIATALGPVQRPHYTWGMVQGAHLARMIGVERISVIELGVAGGNGLLALDRAAEPLEKALGVGIDVYGFDSGSGLPKPQDHRDLPNLWFEGDFAMQEDKLRGRLHRSQLVLGLVDETLPAFLASGPAPLAFIAFDLDLYSSTAQALQLLEADTALLLPRIHCYFDDILGFTFGDHNGERLAIAEFNAAHELRKLSKIYGLRFYVPGRHANAMWVEKYYMAHALDHEHYGDYDGLVRHPQMDLHPP